MIVLDNVLFIIMSDFDYPALTASDRTGGLSIQASNANVQAAE